MMKNLYFFILSAFFSIPGYAQSPDELLKVRSELEAVYKDDQMDRSKMINLNPSSAESRELWKSISKRDSINLTKVERILAKYGWLGEEEIGGLANAALFYVIQHSDTQTQLKYLPMMEEAVKVGKASGKQFALLKDRVLLGLGKKQIYGSQLGRSGSTGSLYVLPLENPEEVDIRRAEVGLPTMQEYLNQFDMIWSILRYESDLVTNKPKNSIVLKPLFEPFKPKILRDSI